MSDNRSFDAVVIGSGFGGTTATLSLANSGATVCLLERGQWWISHEIDYTPPDLRPAGAAPNMREYFEDNQLPYGFWAHPDNVEGLFQLASMARKVDTTGLYDFRVLSENVYSLVSSGVGGGSLVYSNVTLRPHSSVYTPNPPGYPGWPTERDGGPSLQEYFEPAEKFIGVNQITTTAGLGAAPIERSKQFQKAAQAVQTNTGLVVNDAGFSLNLSITDLPNGVFNSLTPNIITHYQSPIETNVCQRQARCNLGCIPGARHTLNKRLFQAVEKNKLPITIKPLAEAYRISFHENDDYPYRVHYKQTIRQKDGSDQIQDLYVEAKKLVVAAGTLGTTELLLKSRDNTEEKLPLSDELGKGFSTDGDLLGYTKLSADLDITRGPINTSHAMFKTDTREFAFSIEDTAISPMVADLFATFLDLLPAEKKRLGFRGRLRLFSALFRKYHLLALGVLFRGLPVKRIQNSLLSLWRNNDLRNILRFMAKNQGNTQGQNLGPAYRIVNWLFEDHERPFASASERLSRFFIFSGMGLDSADGRLQLVPKWEEMEKDQNFREKLSLTDYSLEDNAKLFEEMKQGMKLLAVEIEKSLNPDRPNPDPKIIAPTWDKDLPLKQSLVVLHPLGGCRMGDTIDNGVVDSYGRVFRPDSTNRKETYPDFYVVDGSIIPSPLGVNSSLTITAVALRCMENMVGTKNLPIP